MPINHHEAHYKVPHSVPTKYHKAHYRLETIPGATGTLLVQEVNTEQHKYLFLNTITKNTTKHIGRSQSTQQQHIHLSDDAFDP